MIPQDAYTGVGNPGDNPLGLCMELRALALVPKSSPCSFDLSTGSTHKQHAAGEALTPVLHRIHRRYYDYELIDSP